MDAHIANIVRAQTTASDSVCPNTQKIVSQESFFFFATDF